MKVFTAVDEGGDYFMVLAAPGINRTSFESQVRIRLAEESVPNPDIKAQRLTLQEWPTMLGLLSDGEAYDDYIYADLVWTYPGEWVTLGYGEQPPVPAEFLSRGLDDSDAYPLDDPKHPTYHERMAGIWDGREK